MTLILFFTPIITALINSAVQMIFVRISISMRAMTSEDIYRKALKLTSTAKGNTSTGELVNIMSSDTNMVLLLSSYYS